MDYLSLSWRHDWLAARSYAFTLGYLHVNSLTPQRTRFGATWNKHAITAGLNDFKPHDLAHRSALHRRFPDHASFPNPQSAFRNVLASFLPAQYHLVPRVMNFDDMRRRADAVRGIPLPHVLRCWGAVRDRRDKRQWRTAGGPLSVTGAKFINWRRQAGGGGAIDLVMHLGQTTYLEAVVWLEQHSGSHAAVLSAGRPTSASSSEQFQSRILQLPVANHGKLEPVRRYLMDQRCLQPSILDPLLTTGKVYADQRANAVFLMVAGKANRPMGAELRGTGHRQWRGMAPGSRKDSGYFWIGAQGASTIVLCESAIDAISCFQLRGDCICISTAGVRANPKWLSGLITGGFDIHCGFDADGPGDQSAAAMMRRHPCIHRLRPPSHDWNDVLRDRRC